MAEGLFGFDLQQSQEGLNPGGPVPPPPPGVANDPGASLVDELLSSMELPQAPEAQEFSKAQNIMGAIGDAMTAFAAVRAGGTPPRIGAFAARKQTAQLQDQQNKAAAEAEARNIRNRIRVKDFDRRVAERARARTGGGVDTKDFTTTITQRQIDLYGLDASSLDQTMIVRDRIDKRTGETLGRELIGPATAKTSKVTTKEFETTITEEMATRFNLPKDSVGQFARVRDSLDATGLTTRREILGPGTETSTVLVTTGGFVERGTKSGKLSTPLLNPETGEKLIPFQEETLFLRQQVEESHKLKRFQLPAGILKDLTEEGVGKAAAENALRKYVDLGSPDLGFLFDITPDILKNKDALRARRLIAEAVVPIRKFFSGAAVTPAEAKFAESLIANIDGPINRGVLRESLLGLINISRRARQRILLDARANGLDISGFESELSSGELDSVDSIEEFLEGGSTKTFMGKFFIDENGQLKVEGE